MQINDIVVRKKYNKDIYFKIVDIQEDIYILKGIETRLVANAYIDDLEVVNYSSENIEDYNNKVINHFIKPENYLCGKILHLDGDKEYLDKCLSLYKSIGVYAKGYMIDEENMSMKVIELIEKHNPDIIVITGHDSFNKKDVKNPVNYDNSINFYKTIKEIRKRYSLDNKIIIAGACQSNFELLISAGANFASSPKRVNIHVYDPAIVAIKASVTSFDRNIDMEKIIKHSYIKRDGLGGIETKGKMRLFI